MNAVHYHPQATSPARAQTSATAFPAPKVGAAPVDPVAVADPVADDAPVADDPVLEPELAGAGPPPPPPPLLLRLGVALTPVGARLVTTLVVALTTIEPLLLESPGTDGFVRVEITVELPEDDAEGGVVLTVFCVRGLL